MINDNNITYRNSHRRDATSDYTGTYQFHDDFSCIADDDDYYNTSYGAEMYRLVVEKRRYCAWVLSLSNTIHAVPCRMMSTFFVGTTDHRCIYMRPQTLGRRPSPYFGSDGGRPGGFRSAYYRHNII